MNADRTYTAWELAADHEWIDEGYVALTLNGRVEWETASATKAGDGRTVQLSRLETRPNRRVRVVMRYVAPETLMRLVKVA